MPTTPPLLIEFATRHASHLERVKTHDVNELRKLLTDIESMLLGRLSRNDITTWTRSRAETQLESFRLMLRDSYDKQLIPAIYRQIDELALYEAAFEARSLGNVTVNYSFKVATENQILTAVRLSPLSVRGPDNGSLLEAFIDGWSDRQITGTTNAIRAGFAQGQTTGEVVRNLRDVVFKGNDTNLQGVVRTTLQHAANQAREATWRANADIVKRVRWVSTLDSRTSDQCMAMDGRVFPIDEGPRPPLHYQCRSSTVAVLDDRFAFLEEGATRSDRDPETGKVGSAPANQTYYGWLKTQPAQVQDSIIGPTRGKLLRDGGLSAQRFSELQLSKEFLPLSLDAMRELDPVAFARASITL